MLKSYFWMFDGKNWEWSRHTALKTSWEMWGKIRGKRCKMQNFMVLMVVVWDGSTCQPPTDGPFFPSTSYGCYYNCIFCYFLFSALLAPSWINSSPQYEASSKALSLLMAAIDWSSIHCAIHSQIWNTQKYTRMWCNGSWMKKLLSILKIWFCIFKK